MERPSPPFEKTSVIAPKRLDQTLDFSRVLEELSVWDTSLLFQSLEENSILTPILVAKINHMEGIEGALMVIDGFKRLKWALEQGLNEVPVLKAGDMTRRQVLLLLLSRYSGHLKTCATKALFLNHLSEAGFPKNLLMDLAMKEIGLQPFGGLFEKYLRVSTLPKEVLRFCHEKDLSLKRCLNLTHQPKLLLEKIIRLRHKISISASLLLELTDNISDILKRDEITAEEFFEKEEIKKILSNEMDTNQRTRLFRKMVKEMRHPLLTRLQGELQNIQNNYFKNSPLLVKWDETLENKKVTISASVSHLSELSDIVDAISSAKTKEGIKKILSYF